jgi:hypothetical protein
MPRFAHADVLDNGPAHVKANCDKLTLISGYTFDDSYATVVAAIVAEVAMTTTDFTHGSSGNDRTLTSASGKQDTAANASTNQYDNGTATGGSTLTLADTAKAWSVNGQAGRAAKIIAGTGAGQIGIIVSNTSDTLTIGEAWAVAPDATSVYKIVDDMHFAFVDTVNSKVLWVTQETSGQVITAGNPVNFPALVYKAVQPVAA